jgi:transcriptional regulator with PAS, ATPase and Fis domain
VRFIAATNADLDKLLAKGQFRKDLYYRLKGAWLFMIPLRERREDIPLLINAFLREFRGELSGHSVEDDALDILLNYDYPGNVRELRSIIQSSCNLSQKKPIATRFLPEYIRKVKPKAKVSAGDGSPILPLAEIERVAILRTYEETGSNKLRTAKILAIGLNTLRRKLVSYGVE